MIPRRIQSLISNFAKQHVLLLKKPFLTLVFHMNSIHRDSLFNMKIKNRENEEN